MSGTSQIEPPQNRRDDCDCPLRLRLSQPFHDLAHGWRSAGRIALSQDDAETIIEAVAIFDCDCLGEATRGDGEVIEEADAA
jgi:hypothetical protein